MSAKSSGFNPQNKRSWGNYPYWSLPLLDAIAILAWGILLLKYWFTGKLNLLIHPDYFWLVIVTGVILILMAVIKGTQLFRSVQQRSAARRLGRNIPQPTTMNQHLTLFPPGWSGGLLLATAILGLLITPKVFSSQTAVQRGVTDTVTLTRSQPQAFRSVTRPEARSLIDWVRTIDVYPEPDAYQGQKVKVQGFVVHSSTLPAEYLTLSRFVITCCAADAYPVGLPVKLTQNRDAYPQDTWLEVEGQMITETLEGKRQVVISAKSLTKIPEPKNPYYY